MNIVTRNVPKKLGLSNPLLDRIYSARGVDRVELSLSNLAHPSGLSGLNKAASLLGNAIREGKSICIAGDYDVDGATSIALCLSVLYELKTESFFYSVPNRAEGYGLKPETAEHIRDQGGDIIVTVDNGIKNHDGIARAKGLGMDVIVTDHHMPGETLPAADAIVNPKLGSRTWGGYELAGVGVAFYLMAALRKYLGAKVIMSKYLDLVALGTIADVVTLDYNNRVLCEFGLRLIREGKCNPAITEWLKVGGRNPQTAVASDISFFLAPRLNAIGRLYNMRDGIDTLIDFDPAKIRELNPINEERKSMLNSMVEHASTLLPNPIPSGICLHSEKFHAGLNGLVANKLKEKYFRPTIILNGTSDVVSGSARTVGDLSILSLIRRIDQSRPGLIKTYGGHSAAAGISLPRENIKEFAHIFNREVEMVGLPEKRIVTDGELMDDECTIANARHIYYGGPWGQGFPHPKFYGKYGIHHQQLIGGGHHLKMKLNNGIDAVYFGRDKPINTDSAVLVYQLGINEWKGETKIQFLVEYAE